MNERRTPWLLAGHAAFAKTGPDALRPEVLARSLGRSKSSFYHYFGSRTAFEEALLSHHRARVRTMATAEAQLEAIFPGLIELLLEHREELMFHRQLRIHRERTDFAACVAETDHQTAQAIGAVFARSLGLGAQPMLSVQVLQLATENFYLQLTPERLTEPWLTQYFTELLNTVRHLRASPTP